MSWSTRNKIFYFFVFLVVLIVLIGIPSFLFFHETPTCSDGVHNGEEQGIDCGGSCQKLCRAGELNPVVFWQRVLSIAGTTYTAVAYVQNPNPNAEAFDVPYTFTFYNEANQVIGTKTGTAYLPPGQKLAILESGITFAAAPARTDFQFSDNVTWLVPRKGLPDLEVIGLVASNATTSPSVDLDLRNSTFTSAKDIEVVALVYDSGGNVFAASKTYIEQILGESTRHVVFTWPRPFDQPMSRVEVIPLVRALQ